MAMHIEIKNCDPVGTRGRRLEVVRCEHGRIPVILATLGPGQSTTGYVYGTCDIKCVEVCGPG